MSTRVTKKEALVLIAVSVMPFSTGAHLANCLGMSYGRINYLLNKLLDRALIERKKQPRVKVKSIFIYSITVLGSKHLGLSEKEQLLLLDVFECLCTANKTKQDLMYELKAPRSYLGKVLRVLGATKQRTGLSVTYSKPGWYHGSE